MWSTDKSAIFLLTSIYLCWKQILYLNTLCKKVKFSVHPETQMNSWKITSEIISQQQTIKKMFLKIKIQNTYFKGVFWLWGKNFCQLIIPRPKSMSLVKWNQSAKILSVFNNNIAFLSIMAAAFSCLRHRVFRDPAQWWDSALFP